MESYLRALRHPEHSAIPVWRWGHLFVANTNVTVSSNRCSPSVFEKQPLQTIDLKQPRHFCEGISSLGWITSFQPPTSHVRRALTSASLTCSLPFPANNQPMGSQHTRVKDTDIPTSLGWEMSPHQWSCCLGRKATQPHPHSQLQRIQNLPCSGVWDVFREQQVPLCLGSDCGTSRLHDPLLGLSKCLSISLQRPWGSE